VVCGGIGQSVNLYWLGYISDVGLSGGRVLLKTVTRGNEYGTWTLTSYNAAPINDANIDWYAQIEWVQLK